IHDCPEQRRRDGKIKRRLLRGAERLANCLECSRVVVVAVHITQQTAQFLECVRVQSAVFLQTISCPGLQLVEVPACFGDADDRNVEVPALQHRLQSREDFFVSQVARGAEKDKSIGMGWVHTKLGCSFQQEVTEETVDFIKRSRSSSGLANADRASK